MRISLGCRALADVIFPNVEGIDSRPFSFRYSRPFCKAVPHCQPRLETCLSATTSEVTMLPISVPLSLIISHAPVCRVAHARLGELNDAGTPTRTVAPCHSAPLSIPGPVKAASSHRKRRAQEWDPATRGRADTAVKLLCSPQVLGQG